MWKQILSMYSIQIKLENSMFRKKNFFVFLYYNKFEYKL